MTTAICLGVLVGAFSTWLLMREQLRDAQALVREMQRARHPSTRADRASDDIWREFYEEQR